MMVSTITGTTSLRHFIQLQAIFTAQSDIKVQSRLVMYSSTHVTKAYCERVAPPWIRPSTECKHRTHRRSQAHQCLGLSLMIYRMSTLPICPVCSADITQLPYRYHGLGNCINLTISMK